LFSTSLGEGWLKPYLRGGRNGTNARREEAIVEKIVKQLGGRRFIIMTGAYDFLTLDSGVRFRLPSKDEFTKQGIDQVTVILTIDDTYTVRFETGEGVLVSEHEGIFNDQLQKLFTSENGLNTYL